ncbi:hypothetical protein CU254_02415 [Amycolatopsis sp. AA4]|uniref:hypothetical protein n=1 Tax=Actinomycetes TaxID=1760 RepID=UPI0001B539AD|nr:MULTISPECIES: hypothetical protein [Actinomycetes]ATY09458.1 hypothetical protein CU254_02415 [Amycolatopsis sp. AA4]EFL04796.1 conserved hypothetical protein [Streptomyces sp. AA4]
MLVFGEPYETSQGTVLITVARQGRRGGPGRAVGLYAINKDGVTWTPAVDQGRISLIAVCTGFVAAALSTLAVVRRPPWPDLTERAMIAQARNGKPRP